MATKTTKKADENKKQIGYKQGAIAGALIGVVIAIYFRKNAFYGGMIGLIAGGYIGHLTTKKDKIEKTTFKPVY